jgi:hypothetical protein
VRLPFDHIVDQSSLPQPGADRIAITTQLGMRDCLLIRPDRNDAFTVYGIGARRDSKPALRRLTNRK